MENIGCKKHNERIYSDHIAPINFKQKIVVGGRRVSEIEYLNVPKKHFFQYTSSTGGKLWT